MKKLTKTLFLTTFASSLLLAAGAFAQELGAPNEGNGESMRAAPADGFEIGKATPIPVPKVEDESSRAAPMDEATTINSFSVVTKSRDGKETRSEPSEALKALIVKSMGGEKKTEADPAAPAAGEEASRQVFGSDDRVQVKNTKIYPFTTFGYIQGKTSGGYASCSGTLIGPRTVLTAAHCLYNHDDKNWLDEVVYVPSLNGSTAEDAPFGAYPYETISVVEGFVTNYQGIYDSVLPWDLGIITLADPIGDNLGYLAVYNYEDLSDFDANITGYPGDKPMGTMWRAACTVIAEAIEEGIFTYDCDTFPGSSGSAVYVYDTGSRQRVVTGVNVAESASVNLAVRINATYLEWIKGLWK